MGKPKSTGLLIDHKLEYEDVPLKKPTNRRDFSRGKSIKVLTKKKKGSIIEVVNKAKRKDDKMAHDKNKQSNKRNAVISVAWLIEAAFRAFTGWVLLTNFDHIVTTAAAFYALGTAGVIVVTHFVRAHK